MGRIKRKENKFSSSSKAMKAYHILLRRGKHTIIHITGK